MHFFFLCIFRYTIIQETCQKNKSKMYISNNKNELPIDD